MGEKLNFLILSNSHSAESFAEGLIGCGLFLSCKCTTSKGTFAGKF